MGYTRSQLKNANGTRLAISFKKKALCKVVRPDCGQEQIHILDSLPHVISWALQGLGVRHCVHHALLLGNPNPTQPQAAPPPAAAAHERRANLRELSLQRAKAVCCWPADGWRECHTHGAWARERELWRKLSEMEWIYKGLGEGRLREQGLRTKLIYQTTIQKVSFWDETQPNPTPPVHPSGWMVHWWVYRFRPFLSLC
jgi:hypothetical protein